MGGLTCLCLCVCVSVWCRYGMSSIYPMTMAWPASAGLLLDPKSTTHLVIGGCVGEALVPVVIGELMRVRQEQTDTSHAHTYDIQHITWIAQTPLQLCRASCRVLCGVYMCGGG